MGIHHLDAPALKAAGDFDAEAASEDKMQHISHVPQRDTVRVYS